MRVGRARGQRPPKAHPQPQARPTLAWRDAMAPATATRPGGTTRRRRGRRDKDSVTRPPASGGLRRGGASERTPAAFGAADEFAL